MSERTSRLLGQGVVAGLIGYATVAIVFALANLFVDRSPFHTAAVLGATMFYGATDPSTIAVLPAYVLAFNGVHMLTFLVFGLIGAWLAELADRGEQLWYFSLFFWMFVAFHMVGAAQMLAVPLESVISAVAIWLAGLAASALMALFLLRVHPLLRKAQAW